MKARAPTGGTVPPQFAGKDLLRVSGNAAGSNRRNLTPSIVAGRCFAHLCRRSVEWTGRSTEDAGNVILKQIHDPAWKDPVAGEEQERVLLTLSRSRNQASPAPEEILSRVAALSAAYSVQAIKSANSADLSRAWFYAARAEHWLGVAAGMEFRSRTFRGKSISDFARKGADARHAPNRLMREIVAAHYEQNMGAYKTIDAAAEAIAEKVVDAKFDTVRRVIKLHRKTMRKAGRLSSAAPVIKGHAGQGSLPAE